MSKFSSRDERSQEPRREPQRLKMEPPKQVNLQFLDDTWERLLNAMERLEQVTEGFRHISASRLDAHKDREQIQEDELDVRSEVHLQVKCLQRVTHPVREDARWLVQDFLQWFGGREPRGLEAVDEYAAPILQCILGEPYQLPPLQEAPLTPDDMMRTMEAVGAGLHKSDKIEEQFLEDQDRKATQHEHRRGSVEDGLKRLQRIEDGWLPRFLADFRRGLEDSKREAERREGPVVAKELKDRPEGGSSQDPKQDPDV